MFVGEVQSEVNTLAEYRSIDKRVTWCKPRGAGFIQKFECSECDCEYKLEGLLEKSVKMFCHYFNNDKDCDYDDQ